MDGPQSPDLSVIVVIYNMPREAPRTLLSLSANYQRHIEPKDYEVIVVDNGSTPPVDPKIFASLTGNFRLIRIDPASPSPAQGINRGAAEARGKIIGVMIDGARMVTPGMLHFARHGAMLYEQAVVATLGWHLGADMQRWAEQAGYTQKEEDDLLASINWPSDGYRLFEIATLDESSADGWLRPTIESNALFIRREMWAALGGMDERFDIPGGGGGNADLFCRVLNLPRTELVILLGEATFHQMHKGISTNAEPELYVQRLKQWHRQYRDIRGQPFEVPRPRNPPTYLGVLPRPALASFTHSAIHTIRGLTFRGPDEPPLGRYFDRELWSLAPPVEPRDPTIAALVRLAHDEFRAGRFEACVAVARLTRRYAPTEQEPQRLLMQFGPWLPRNTPPREQQPAFHRALGQAYRLLGDEVAAASHFSRASTLEEETEKPFSRRM
jgi:glycosyltransferase involved in cell wall biosynthesis